MNHPPIPAEPAAKTESLDGRIEPQPAKVQTPRDIKLEVSNGGQRVEVRVSDRGGDVHVAVRTSDSNLAGALREDLPALSSRLEQTGLRADSWHAPPPESHGPRAADPPTAASPQNPGDQPQRQSRDQQGEPQQQRPRIFEEQSDRKEKEKEFAWFMSSIR
jgi:hypothetical protein